MSNKKYNSFKKFIAESERGDVFVYHTGDLPNDRKGNEVLNELALSGLDYFQRGFVELAQKRLGKANYEYRAIRTNDVGRRYFKGCYRVPGKKED